MSSGTNVRSCDACRRRNALLLAITESGADWIVGELRCRFCGAIRIVGERGERAASLRNHVRREPKHRSAHRDTLYAGMQKRPLDFDRVDRA